MRLPAKYVLILCLTIPAGPGGASAQSVFSNLYPRDGLSSKEVLCSYTDTAGFVWFGTATGLNRWDGSRFQVITPHSRIFPGLPHETIMAVQGWRGQLLVGTARGLCVLDRRRSRFVPMPFLRRGDTVRDVGVQRLQPVGGKLLLAATNRGVFIYSDGRMLPISTVVSNAGVLDSFNAVIYPGKDGRVWVSADSSMYLLDLRQRKCYSRQHNPQRWKIFAHVYPTTLSEDATGRLWFSTYYRKNGLFCFDPSTNAVREIGDYGKQFICLLYHDRRNRMWISTTKPLAAVLDHTAGKLQVLESGSVSYPVFNHVQEDVAGNMWFATANGVSKLPATQPLEAYIPLPTLPNKAGAALSLVNQLAAADSGGVWVCKDDGLYRMSLPDYTFRRFSASGETESRENRFFDIRYLQGQWWCGTGAGIMFCDERSGKFTPFTAYPAGKTPWRKSVMWMRQDGQGFIWFASWVDAVYRYDPGTKTTIRIADNRYGDIGPCNSLFGLLDHYGRFWIGMSDKGVRCWDPKREQFYNPVAAGKDRDAITACIVYSMVEDEKSGYWLATDRLGAVHLDSGGHILQHISLEDGLNTTAALNVWMQPGGKRLWIATAEGVQVFETKRRLLSAIGIDFGILVKDYCSVILGLRNKAYVSVNGKIAVMNLDVAGGTSPAPRPLLTGIRVFEQERPVPSPDSILRLKNNENFFAIDFSSPLHRELPAIQYAYRLEGFDEDWVFCGRRQTASYTNVSPGRYTFRLRSTNELGEWQKNETTMEIGIRGPFWKEPLFLIVSAAGLLLGLFHLVRYVNRRKRRARIESTIAYFARSIHGENSVADICWDISRNCTSQMRLEDCVVYLVDRERNVLYQAAAYGPKNPYDQVIENPLEIRIGEGIVGAVAATGKAILVGDTRKDARYLMDDARRLSELAVPIIHDGEVIGVIDSEHSARGFYKDAHLNALTTIASISSNKIAEAQAEASVRKNERELLQIRSMLADSQLMALRTQMNPHFVFNCLNSIQECIVTGKVGEASQYLNKFSRLFRALLDNSGKPLIPLQEEINVLELYLTLEHMRFEGSFDYTLEVDEELEIEEIMIPSMLLQPFVENALWHGLMHKEGERRLTIAFEAIPGDLFRCTIDDNGIGRERAGTLKASRSTGKSHISRGLQITEDRIVLMQRRGQSASLRIIDKHDTLGKATGTTVVIELSAYLTNLES